MKEQRFKVGDKVTYKSRKDCTHYGGNNDSYYFGGVNQGANIGKILRYDEYIETKGCWRIEVTVIQGSYSMLESEFLEYDELKPIDLFPIY